MKSTAELGATPEPSGWAALSCGSPEDGRRIIVTGVAFSLLYIASLAAIRWAGVPPALRVPIALVPAPAFAAFMWAWIRGVRGMDEMQRRIQLEALAFAFPATLLLLLTLGLLERVVTLPADDLSYRHVWAMLPMLYFFGLWLAVHRYR